MYQIIYYNNGKQENYTFLFNTIWGAIFKARCITESHGFPTDVIDMQYGNILATFSPDEAIYTDPDLPENIQELACTPIT